MIASRENWNADLGTVNKFVDALVKAGVSREEFGGGPPGKERATEVTLPMAREAAELLAGALGRPIEDVWGDFLQPFEKYKGEPWTVPSMVREVGKITRQRLGLERPDTPAGGEPIMLDEPGPQNIQAKGVKSRRK
ncbi:MAG: hypothetical protein H0U56_15510 [Methylibium sp.]|nr:hypothetical protein [Methylibium sp.]